MNRNYLNNGVRQGYRTVPPRAVPAMSGGSCGMTQSRSQSNPQLQSQAPSQVQPQPNPQHGSGMALAMAYVPSQAFEGLYPAAEALRHGTLFTALNLPYCAGGGR